MTFKQLLIVFAAMAVLLLSCDVSTDSNEEGVEPVDDNYKRINVPVITNYYLIVK